MGVADLVLLVVRGLDPVGTGRQVELAAGGLAAAGRPVAVAITTTGGSLPARLATAGIPTHQLGGRPVGDIAATMRLIGLVRRLRPAAIIGFGRSEARRVAIARRFAARARAIGWVGLGPADRRQAWSLRGLDRLVATSPQVAAAWQRAGLASGRLTVVPPGSDPDSCSGLGREEIAARLGIDPRRQWTLAVAPLEPAARLPRLLWAIDQLGVVRSDLAHLLVGAGPLRESLWRRARAQELTDRLVVLPDCELLPDLLGQVQLVWQSGEVAVGGAILDGMARGLPVVAVESEAAGQLIADDGSGRVVPPVPESEFPRAAFRILEDDSLVRRYGEAGRTRAAEQFAAGPFVAGLLAAVEAGG
jgi:glycosyltransferase involved in cell wall biosynthesis